ncbi:MAG: hypothetical protein ACRENE_07170 [Polyangiaceae bacterium]
MFGLPLRLPPPLGTLVLSLVSLLSLTLALLVVYPRTEAVEHVTGGHSGPTNLPWSFRETGEENQLDLTLPHRPGGPTRWNIRPDDILTALTVNGRDVPLGLAKPQSGLKDWQCGFDIDLAPWLHLGDNRLELTVTNTGGPGGITMRPLLGWRPLLLAAGLLPWLWTLARMFRLRLPETVILGFVVVILCWYWGSTQWYERTYDVKRYGEGGHLDYVIYLAERARLPPPYEGWQYYQPPGYYAVGALAWRWAKWVGISGPEILQGYSLSLWIVFVTASVAALELTLHRPRWVLWLSTAALGLWPSGVISALRIGNDLAMYAVAGVATYYMCLWWKGRRRRHLVAMSLWIGAVFLCKTSGAALLASGLALVGLWLLRHGRWRRRLPWLEALAAAAVMGAGVLLGLARNIGYWRQGKLPGLLVSNIAGLEASLRVPNDVRNFIPLDVPVFLTEPWMSTRSDATGRANFWNFFLRSSLSGEFSFPGKLHVTMSLVWGAMLLWLLSILLLRPFVARLSFATWRAAIASQWRDAPWYALGFFWVASAFAARWGNAYSCVSDFRYVVPALVPFVLACARGGWVARGLLCFAALSSVVFFVSV